MNKIKLGLWTKLKKNGNTDIILKKKFVKWIQFKRN